MRINFRGLLRCLDRQRERCSRPVMLCAAAIMLFTPGTLRAEFVLALSPVETVSPLADSGGDVPNEQNSPSHLGTRCKARAICAPMVEAPSLHRADNSQFESRKPDVGGPTGSGGNDGPGSPAQPNDGPWQPMNFPAADSHSGQSMGGSGAGLGSAGSSPPAGLPSSQVLVGPELAIRLFAKEAHLQIEQIASRLFRPPRA